MRSLQDESEQTVQKVWHWSARGQMLMTIG